MAEASEPGRPESAGSGSLEEDEEDEEREPLLPRIVWAQRRKVAPGGAVRLETAAGEEGAASPSQASDRELPLLLRDAPPGVGERPRLRSRLRQRNAEVPPSSPLHFIAP